jgi:hypothetical protein
LKLAGLGVEINKYGEQGVLILLAQALNLLTQALKLLRYVNNR